MLTCGSIKVPIIEDCLLYKATLLPLAIFAVLGVLFTDFQLMFIQYV